MITIPTQNKTFIQTNRSSILGNILSSKNLDLQSNPGVIRVSPRIKAITTTADDADLGLPVGFVYFDAGIWTVAGTRVFKSTAPNVQNAFAEDTSTNYATDYLATCSDIITAFGLLWTTTTDDLMSKAANGSNTGDWTAGRLSLGAGGNHMMCYFKKYDRLYVVDLGSRVKSINSSFSTATSGDYYINVSTSTNAYTITSIKSTSNSIWIGVIDTTNQAGRGKILQWDGLSNQVTNEYILNAQGCAAIVIDGDIPYAMDTNGVFLKFSGGSFEEVGRLPITKELLKGANGALNSRFIHPNGLIATGSGTFLALVGNLKARGSDSISTYSSDERFSSGLYELDGRGSCVHQNSLTYTNTTTITDYGQNRILLPGGLANMNLYSATVGNNGTLIMGATIYTNASSTTSGVFVDDALNAVQKYGYLVTPWIFSSDIRSYWESIHIKYRKLLNSTDRIHLKYRTTETSPFDISITWVNTTSFTTTTDLSAYVGHEVEILMGTGSGKCAHIVSQTGSGTYTVTIDEAVAGVTTGTAIARVQNWTLLKTISDQTTESFQQKWNKSTERIQFKLGMLFTGDNEVFELGLSPRVNVPAK